MPLRFRMDDLRQQCLRNVDLENDASIALDEANAILSDIYGSMVYSTVVGAGCRYFETSTTFVTAGLGYIDEPSDHLSMVDTIERVLDSAGRLRRLKQLEPQERSVWAGRTGHARRWEFADDHINLYPTPPSGDQYILRYVPQPPSLKAFEDGQTVDVVTPDGLSVMLWGAGVRLLAKAKQDVTLCLKERDEARERLLEWAQLRAFNEPHRIVVDESEDYDLRADGSYWYDR